MLHKALPNASIILLLLALLAVIAVPNVAFAAGGGHGVATAFSTLAPSAGLLSIPFTDSLGVASLAVLFSLTLVGLSYMLGEVLKIESLKKWYQSELWESVKSILIIVSVFAVLIIAGGVATSLAGNQSNTYLSGNVLVASNEIAYNIMGLGNTANAYVYAETNTLQNSFDMIYGLSYGVDLLKSISISLWIPIPIPPPIPPLVGFMFGSSSNIYVSSIIAAASPGSQSQSVLADYSAIIMLPLLILYTIQQNYLLIIMSIGLIVFLPMGVILRAIPILRPIGATFIALGIGLAIVYPALLVAFNLPMTNFANSIFAGSPAGCVQTQLPGPVLGRFGPVLNYGVSTSCDYFSYGFSAGTSAIASVYPPLNIISYTLINAIIQFILLIFDLVIGLVITGDIAKLLGGRLPTGIGKFKVA